MTDYKEYAKQMRENAVKNEQGNIVCSPVLWEQIASVVERAIIPPCKVGDTVYYPYEYGNRVLDKTVKKIVIEGNDKWLDVGVSFLPFENIGKTVFLTKEEAEAELRKRGEQNA